jgi:O-antigen ligase
MSIKTQPLILNLAITYFITWSFISTLVSGNFNNQAFWGVFGRNNGLLTFFNIILIMYIFNAYASKNILSPTISTLLITGTITAILILAKSFTITNPLLNYQTNFGTFGNVNFASSFLSFSILISFYFFFLKGKPSLAQTLLLLFDIFIKSLAIFLTKSLQGIVLTFIGLMIYLGLNKYTKNFINHIKSRFLIYVFGLSTFIASSITILNWRNLKPLMGESLIYRFDYWSAGINMIQSNPIFGVGFDSYVDNYRIYRNFNAAQGNGSERFSDSAHNIFIDIGAFGGLPLAISFLLIASYILIVSLKSLYLTQGKDKSFNMIFTIWVMYQIQSLISINQISLSVWGWAISGILLGYNRQNNKKNISFSKLSGSPKVITYVTAIILGLIGFFLSAKPLFDDARIYSAINSRNGNAIYNSIIGKGATSFHLKTVLNIAVQNGDRFLATSVIDELKTRYPKDVGAWKIILFSEWFSENEKLEALKKLRELDPQVNYPNLKLL